MTNQQVITLIAASFTLAAIRGGWASFESWRDKRLLQPAGIRNAGFWTDRKVYVAERSAIWTWRIIASLSVIGAIAMGILFSGAL